jgi:hypothetical protein
MLASTVLPYLILIVNFRDITVAIIVYWSKIFTLNDAVLENAGKTEYIYKCIYKLKYK